jgi:hypothetical protein
VAAGSCWSRTHGPGSIRRILGASAGSLIDTVILLVPMLMFLASIYPDYFSLDPEAPMYRGPIEVVIQYGVSFSIRCYFGN